VSTDDLAALYSRCLRAVGVTRAFRAPGHALPAPDGIPVVDVPDADIATLLADAEGRLARAPDARPGLALLPGRRVRLSSRPGADVLAHPVVDPAVLVSSIAGWTLGRVHAAVELEIDLDLSSPAPTDLEALAYGAADDRLVTLSPTLATLDMVIVIGPGVVRDGQVAGVAEAARRTGARVVATPGAVGVLPLDDPAWCGAVGLQAGDAAMAGISAAELVVVAGLDPSQTAGVVPPGVQVLEVEPWHLGLMAIRWAERDPGPVAAGAGAGVPARSALVDGLAALGAGGRASSALPLHPVRAMADLADVLHPEELVLADPGAPALWLERGIVARPAGSIVVPSLPVRGFAVAGAVVSALDGRAAVAVVTAPSDPATDALLDLAAALGLSVVCEVWGTDDTWSSAAEHRERLVGARHEGGVQRLAVPVDLAFTEELLDLAGPVVAWTDVLDDDLGSAG